MSTVATTEVSASDAADKGGVSATEQGLAVLKHWRDRRACLWVYFAAYNGGVASIVQAQVAEASRCLVLQNTSAILRFDLKNARFRHGPLQVLVTPTELGRAAVLTRKPHGLVGEDGLLVALESGHSLFIRECPADGSQWSDFAAALEQNLDRLLGR